MAEQSLELQLVIIAVLIPAYLETIPAVIAPTFVMGVHLSMQIIKFLSYLLGWLWFGCLIIGATSLAGDKDLEKISLKIYRKLFRANIIVTLGFFFFVIVIYAFYFGWYVLPRSIALGAFVFILIAWLLYTLIKRFKKCQDKKL